ncbi:MAG: HDOD domain-containing protein [Planctomycetes bacterium]|nr:HDOD domain-containing protein [Planctomycetota bacterium]
MSTSTLSQPVAQNVKSEEHAKSLEHLFRRIGQLSSLPSVAQRILQVAGDEESNATDLLKVVGQDPALSIRILKTVNSSYYGLLNEVADLKTAISMLGFVEVRKLAMTVYVARLCEEPTSHRDFSREGLWKHMVAVGAIARLISQILRRGEPEEAYIAGLLHDVGLLLVDQYMHGQLCHVIDLVVDGMGTTEAEQKILTFDHTDLGTYIAAQSNLPERIIAAIQFHHRPCEYQGKDRTLLDIISVANYLASHKKLTSLGVQNVAAPTDTVCESLGLQKQQMAAIFEELDIALESAEVLASI